MPARMLVIEDNPANLELMAYLLRAFGHTVQAAAEGSEGLQAAQREQPDLIICDVQMPGMDGFEVARQLKGHPMLRSTPLIAVTAFAMVGDRDRVLAGGFDGYLAKPIDPSTFVQQVEAYLRPAQRSAAALPDAPTLPATAPLPPRRQTIMVVDNLPVQLELARSIFEPSGYEVITTEGIQQALALARQSPPDLIISDVHLTEGSGFEFLHAVKADPGLQAIPFVFLTATSRNERDRVRALALGAVKFLYRPIEPHVLLAEIAQCLQQR